MLEVYDAIVISLCGAGLTINQYRIYVPGFISCLLYTSIAEEEGFTEIARQFRGAGAVEQEHENRYRKLADNLTDGKVFERDTEVLWQCINCGHIQKSKAAPEKCPVCQHPKAYFQLKEDNY